MADDFAEYIYGTMVKTSEDGRVWEMTPQSERRERVRHARWLVSHGAPMAVVAAECGVSYEALRKWMKREVAA